MRCKYCGAVFRGEDLKYCPYCDNDIEENDSKVVYVPVIMDNLSDYEKERRNRVAPIVPKDAKWGELHFTLLRGRGPLSPANGSHYFVIVDEYYETEIISCEEDLEVVIRLPYGSHVLKVRMFPWDDDGYFNEAEYARHDNIKFTIGDGITRMELSQGTVFKSSKLKCYDV